MDQAAGAADTAPRSDMATDVPIPESAESATIPDSGNANGNVVAATPDGNVDSASAVELWDISIGIIKGFFFGVAIAVISCYKGFNCKEGAEGVGRACTEAFVASFISILAINLALAIVFKSLYHTFWPLKSLI